MGPAGSAAPVGFIGAGRIVRIFLGGWSHADALPGTVLVSDPDPQALATVTGMAPGVRAVEPVEAARADTVIVAVPPPAAPATFALIGEHLSPEATVLSLVPRTPLARIAQVLGADRRVARMIPNAPSIVGAGYNPIAFNAVLTGAARERLAGLVAPLGQCPEVPDEHLEAYAILTAMGPTYLWPQFYALLDLAEQLGLDPDAARAGLTAMIEGAVQTMNGAGLTDAQVQDLIPARPMAQPVTAVCTAYRQTLGDLHAQMTQPVEPGM